SSMARPLSASRASDSTTGAARRTNPRAWVAARPLTSRKTEAVSVSVLAFALRCASQSTAAPVSSTSPHTPSTTFARKPNPRAVGAEVGIALGVGDVIFLPAHSVPDIFSDPPPAWGTYLRGMVKTARLLVVPVLAVALSGWWVWLL